MTTNIYQQEVRDVLKLIEHHSNGEFSENKKAQILIAWGKITSNIDLSDADTYYETIKEFEQYLIETY